MFIEPLECRSLLASTAAAATGLDPTFGTAGQVSLPKPFYPGSDSRALVPGKVIASGGGYYFVAGQNYSTNKAFVARLTSAGKLDMTFGTKGFAALPFEAVRMTYDSSKGFLYVGSNSEGNNTYGTAATVTRVLSNGVIDSNYGDLGTFSYTPPKPSAADSDARATVEAINVLPDGSAVVAIDRQTRAGNGGVVDQSVALFKLRKNGTRDPNYGKKGVIQLFGGTIQAYIGDTYTVPQGDRADAVKRAFFADV